MAADGSPALLIGTVGKVLEGSPPPVRLENLSVEHRVLCRVWYGTKVVEEGVFTVLKCPSADGSVRDYFLRVGGPLLLALGNRPSDQQISELVDALVEMFRALAEPPRKSVQGLWAELFLIDRSRAVQLMCAAWHQSPDERYDFSAGRERIEVKSTAGRARRHHFSLEQLTPPATATVLVASVCVERAGGGTSLRDLMAKVKARLASAPDIVVRIDSVVAATLGQGLLAGLEEAFDEQLAAESLAFYKAEAIPKPGQVPIGVSEVRFVADLSAVTPIDPAMSGGADGLFDAVASR